MQPVLAMYILYYHNIFSVPLATNNTSNNNNNTTIPSFSPAHTVEVASLTNTQTSNLSLSPLSLKMHRNSHEISKSLITGLLFGVGMACYQDVLRQVRVDARKANLFLSDYTWSALIHLAAALVLVYDLFYEYVTTFHQQEEEEKEGRNNYAHNRKSPSSFSRAHSTTRQHRNTTLQFERGLRSFATAVIYLICLALLFKYESSLTTKKYVAVYEGFEPSVVAVYVLCALHCCILACSATRTQRQLVYPVSMLVFALSSTDKKFFMLFFVIPQYHCYSKLFMNRERDSEEDWHRDGNTDDAEQEETEGKSTPGDLHTCQTFLSVPLYVCVDSSPSM